MMTRNHETTHSSNNDDKHNNCVKFVVWHTLRKLPREEEVTRTVQLDDDGLLDHRLLTHDWKVHMDVIEGDPRPIIARVEVDFGPTFLRRRWYTWNRPRRITTANTPTNDDDETAMAWRYFETRQKCGGAVPIKISIFGMGGTVLRVKYHTDREPMEGYFYEKNVPAFGTVNPMTCLLPIPLPPNRAFSMELVADQIAGGDTQPETAMSKVLSMPNLVEKMYWERGEEGVESIRQSLVTSINPNANERNSEMVNTVISVQISDDDSPDKRALENMIKMSQNFIKYEDAIDEISREWGTPGAHTLRNESPCARSNKCDIGGDTNRERHDTLASRSTTVGNLMNAMNPRKDQRYKLVLAKEETTRVFLAKFFFFAVPADVELLVALLRFCTLFVHNSFRLKRPNPMKCDRSIQYEIDFLFSTVIRDRFVEEMLLSDGGQKKEHDEDGGMTLRSLCDLSIDMMDDDEVSIPASLMHDQAEDDEFSDISDPPNRKRGLSENQSLLFDDCSTTKRPRPLSALSSAMQCDSPVSVVAKPPKVRNNVDVVFRSDLDIRNKYYTAAKLATIGKKLSTGTSNKKAERLERLKSYFDARDDELKKCINNTEYHCNSGVLGIEFVFKNDANRDANNICVILKRGSQMKVPRRSVCKSKCDEKEFPISLLQMSEAEVKTVFENLNPKEKIDGSRNDYIAGIDHYIEELEEYQSKMDSSFCRFALVHDLFCEDQRETLP